MRMTDELDGRLARLRAEWPVGSMVDDVMGRIRPEGPRRGRRRRVGLFAGLAASGLAAAVVLAVLIISGRPTTLLAAVQDGLKRAGSAHLVITSWDDRDTAYRAEVWYRRDEGLRAESPERVIVEDGKTQWSWAVGAAGGERVVLRQPSPGFFATQVGGMLALPDASGDWTRFRTPALDRAVDGRPCRGFTIPPSELDRELPRGARTAGGGEIRCLVLAEQDGRIHEVTIERRRDGATWRRERAIRIEYDVPVPADKVAARLPEGARVVDRDEAFHARYPLDQTLHQVELGGLLLAVHDLRPLQGGEGYYVVSSVRGTPEFLRAYPPRRRPFNPEVVLLDVAFQPGSNRMEGAKYDRIVLGTAARGGVEFSWWLIVPRRFYRVEGGKRVYLPDNGLSAMPGEPGRLDDLPGKARIPLSATYWDEKHLDSRGVSQIVSTWAEVPLLPDRPPTTLEDIAGRARGDLLIMSVGGAGGLLGIAADTRGDARSGRPMSHFAPEAISDADFAAAVRRGLDDMREFDEVRDIRPGEMLPPLGPGGSGR